MSFSPPPSQHNVEHGALGHLDGTRIGQPYMGALGGMEPAALRSSHWVGEGLAFSDLMAQEPATGPTQPAPPGDAAPTDAAATAHQNQWNAPGGHTPARRVRRSRRTQDVSTEFTHAEALELLRRREAVLLAASFAAGQFISGDWREGIEEALERIGAAASVSRAFLFENETGPDGSHCSVMRHQWCAAGLDTRDFQLPWQHCGALSQVALRLSRGEVFFSHARDLPAGQREVMAPPGVLSLLLVPVFAGDEWWGFMGFDECRMEREPDVSEIETLRLAVDLLGGAVARSRADQALRQSEADLRESEGELRALFAAMDDVILVLDREGRYLKIAPTAHTLLYRPPEILINKTVREIFPAETATEFQGLIEKALDTRTSQRTVYSLGIRGQRIWFEATITPLTQRTVLWVARDITVGYEAGLKLEQQALQLETLFRALPDLFFRLDAAGVILEYKTSSLESLYVSPEEFLGKRMTDVLPGEVTQAFVGAMNGAQTDAQIHSFDYSLTVDNELRAFEARLWCHQNDGFFVVVRDITERREAEEALRRAESKYRSIFENAVEGIFQTSPDGRYLNANPSLARIYGYDTPEELTSSLTDINRQLYLDSSRRLEFMRQIKERGEISNFESQVYRRDGQIIWISENARAVYDAQGEILFFEGTVEDITKRKVAEERLVHDALHDRLTGMANRALFMDRLGQALARLRRHNEAQFAVLFLDCDRFKNVNDSLGHLAGDQLLVSMAQRLEGELRPGDTVARLGGDEFGVLLEDIAGVADATTVAQRIQEVLRLPFRIGGQQVFASASIGIALGNPEYEKAEDLLRDADMAMYRAKATGKARHEVFDSGMHIRAVALLQLETDLRWAIERNEFRVCYQPMVDLKTGRIAGFEALVRWQHPERGIVSPVEFIPVAEETGFIVPIGKMVLEEACQQMARWQMEFPANPPLSVAVNLSGRQFTQPDLLETIQDVLHSTGFSAHCLKMEITESSIMDEADSVTERLVRLRSLGVRLGLDDFGTGYSSLSYLHRFPLNTLKIDRSFVMRMLEGGENREIVRTIVTLGQNLNMDVVAEGVESAEQLADLRLMGCGFGQGYYFARPLSASDAEELLRQNPCW